MTSQTLRQLADVIEKLGQLELSLHGKPIGRKTVIRELRKIRGELYRTAIESGNVPEIRSVICE